MAVNHYETRVRWTGSTGLGWDHYDRTHVGVAPGRPGDRADHRREKGDPRCSTPSSLLLMAASSCQMLWFLHLAAKARIDVVEYERFRHRPDADRQTPVRLTEIELRPRIVVAGEWSEERVRSSRRPRTSTASSRTA